MNSIYVGNELLDWDRVEELVAGNYISARRHRTHPLTIYNYTPKTTFKQAWETATEVCRGLIVDNARNVVSRSFRKFFNLGEQNTVWLDEPYEITEKIDGSLGVSWFHEDEWGVATRGSFYSFQATEATNILRTKYAAVLSQLDPMLSYSWEIIIPENRIVVDYGDMRDLVLLAVFDTITGKELPLDNFERLGFPLVKRYPSMSLTELQLAQLDENSNREGFVVRFESGARAKVKLGEYSMIHRLVTQTTPRKIWEILSTGENVLSLVTKCPPAYQKWVHQTADSLLAQYQEIEKQSKSDFYEVLDAVGTPDVPERELRKRRAVLFTKKKHPSVLFAMLDNYDYRELIWKEIYPEAAQPFKVEE